MILHMLQKKLGCESVTELFYLSGWVLITLIIIPVMAMLAYFQDVIKQNMW